MSLVLKALQNVYNYGLVYKSCQWGCKPQIPRWKRVFNTVAEGLGADKQPFTDPGNFTETKVHPLSLGEQAELAYFMQELAGTPACKVCGSTNLSPDPAGYYEHAERWDGAPFLCLDHSESLEPSYDRA